MSKESLDYKKLCSNYYSSWEEGCCMESCEFYNHDECPVVYVNGLISDLETKLEITEKALELLKYQPNYYRFVNENTETIDVDLAISKAKEMMKSE